MYSFSGNTLRYCLRTALGTPCPCCFWEGFFTIFFQFWILFVQNLCWQSIQIKCFFWSCKFMGGTCLFLEEFSQTKDFSKKWFNFLIFWLNCNLHYLKKFNSSFFSFWLKKINHAIFRKLFFTWFLNIWRGWIFGE